MENILSIGTAFLVLAITWCAPVRAADTAPNYPSRNIRFVVTYVPGGGTDLVARQVGERLTEAWGQQVIIDNRPGAGGIIGTEIVANASPDGHTFLLGTSAGMVTQPLLVAKAPYDPLRAFAPVSLLTVDSHTLYVTASLPVSNLKELIAYAKSRPGSLSYGSAGPGSPNHMNMEQFKQVAGIDLLHVPYKGSAQSMTDLVAGRIQVMWGSTAALVQQAKNGKLKALAVGGPQRLGVLPDVPTVAEAGLPKLELNMPWFSIFVPAKTPRPIITKINAQVVRTLTDPEMVKRLEGYGYDAHSSTPEELGELLRKEYQRVKALLSVLKISPEQTQ